MSLPIDRLPPMQALTLDAVNQLIRLLNDRFSILSLEATRWGSLDIQTYSPASGRNTDMPLPGGASIFRLTGPTSAFSLTGISGGTDGRLIVLINTTSNNMTLSYESSFSQAANRIDTQTGADVSTTGKGSAILLYSGAASRWLLLEVQT